MINISEKILVGLSTPSGNNLPTTTMSPIGKSSGERSKMNSIRKGHKEVLELDNVPLPGFTLTTSGKNTWGSTETIWKVIDPRGFISTISSSNLEKILHYTGITEGLIQEKCVWARENERISMILIPVNAPDYVEAVSNTELISNKVSKRDVKLGDRVLLQNKLTGIYMGTVSLYTPATFVNKKFTIEPKIYAKRQMIKVSPGVYFHQTDLKILSVEESAETPYTKAEAGAILTQDIKNGACFPSQEWVTKTQPNFVANYITDLICHFSYTHSSAADITYTRSEINADEAELLFDTAYKTFDTGLLMLEDSAGRTYLIDIPTSTYGQHRYKYGQNNFKCFMANLTNGHLHIASAHLSPSRYGNGQNFTMPPALRNLTEFTKYYKLTKHTKSETFI